MRIQLVLLSLCVLAAGCGGSSTPADAGAPEEDAAMTTASDAAMQQDDAAMVDAGPALASCPTADAGAILAPGACFVFTPEQAGASAAGANAATNEYALEPVGTARNELVVQLNGSLGSPAGQIADPATNLYGTLASAGFHVIGLAYRSDDIVGSICNDGPCYEAVRRTVVTGTYDPGAPSSLADMRLDEGIVERLEAALQHLAEQRPGEGWAQYLGATGSSDLAARLAWAKIIPSGHSQGGGHAAFAGKLFAVPRVVQLSSTCDAVGPTPAPWTAAADGWVTSPSTSFVGFAAPTIFDGTGKPTGGDRICPYHVAVWQNMGMAAGNMHDDAATCGNTGDTHGESIGCTQNAPRWAALYE